MEQVSVKQNFKWLARLGYAARGVIYVVIGSLAVMAAVDGGEQGKTTDSKGAITTIADQPFGQILLVILVIGLLGYSLWRFFQAIKDTDEHGKDAKGLAIRGGLLVSAISHLALAVWTVTLLMGSGSQGGSQSSQGLLSSGPGQVLIGIAGLAALGAGIAHIIKGWTARFERYLEIPKNKDRLARPICRFGLISRGVVWCIVGWFLMRSAWRAGDNDISGISEALQSLAGQGFGTWLLLIVAVGLVAFGLYSFLEAMYRRVDVHKS